MNPMLRALLSGGLNSFASSTPDILNTPSMLEQGYRYAAMGAAKDMPKSNTMDRIKETFSALKDMHKADSQPVLDASQMPWLSSLTFPMKAPASQGFPQSAPMDAQASIPMPAARPAEAPQQDPMMSAFQRNIALQKDPSTGEYLDPTAAAKADPGIFRGLFA